MLVLKPVSHTKCSFMRINHIHHTDHHTDMYIGRPLGTRQPSTRPLSLRGLTAATVPVDAKPKLRPRVPKSIVYTYISLVTNTILMFAPIPVAFIMLCMHKCNCFAGSYGYAVIPAQDIRRLLPYACCVQYVTAIAIVFMATSNLPLSTVHGLLVSVLTALLLCSRIR
jgi:hypothetical protein